MFEQQIRSFDGEGFSVAELARVAYRATTRPILRVDSRPDSNARRRLLILSGVHGNEHAGILAIPEVLARFHAARGALSSVALCVLTPVNPVGAAETSRFNAHGYDINRDFVRFDTEEARAVRGTMDAFRPDLALSLHEGPQDASFMFANAHVDVALADRLLRALESGGTLARHARLFRRTTAARWAVCFHGRLAGGREGVGEDPLDDGEQRFQRGQGSARARARELVAQPRSRAAAASAQ